MTFLEKYADVCAPMRFLLFCLPEKFVWRDLTFPGSIRSMVSAGNQNTQVPSYLFCAVYSGATCHYLSFLAASPVSVSSNMAVPAVHTTAHIFGSADYTFLVVIITVCA